MRFQPILRRTFLATLLSLSAALFAEPAFAASQAEDFVQQNIHKGLELLNNKQLSTDQRRTQFEGFLLGLTDMKRIADFTLGQYRRTASPQDLAAFEAAFQNYAVAVYQSYFAKYAGQSLKVTGSSQRAPDDFIVTTVMVDPNARSGQRPLEVDFRVRTDSGRPELVDISVLGIWLALSQRDQFVAFLAQNRGDVKALTAHMRQTAAQYR